MGAVGTADPGRLWRGRIRAGYGRALLQSSFDRDSGLRSTVAVSCSGLGLPASVLARG